MTGIARLSFRLAVRARSRLCACATFAPGHVSSSLRVAAHHCAAPPQPRGGRPALAGERTWELGFVADRRPPLPTTDALFAANVEWKVSHHVTRFGAVGSVLDRSELPVTGFRDAQVSGGRGTNGTARSSEMSRRAETSRHCRARDTLDKMRHSDDRPSTVKCCRCELARPRASLEIAKPARPGFLEHLVLPHADPLFLLGPQPRQPVGEGRRGEAGRSGAVDDGGDDPRRHEGERHEMA